LLLLASGLLLWVAVAGAEKEFVISNERDDPATHTFWDYAAGRPIEWWVGNYSDVVEVSCVRSRDLLFDWAFLKESLTSWLRELYSGGARSHQTYWERIRPMQHALTNIIAYHNFTANQDCFLGMLAVRMFYLVGQSQEYKESQFIIYNSFVLDWHYIAHRFGWSVVVRSGWGDVIFPSFHLLSNSFRQNSPWLSWIDCDRLPHASELDLPRSYSEVVMLVTDADRSRFTRLAEAIDGATAEDAWKCPVALSFSAVVVAVGSDVDDAALRYLDLAQGFIQMYSEKKDFTVVNLANIEWPIWETLARMMGRFVGTGLVENSGRNCTLSWCPDGGTPVPTTCSCERLFPEPHPSATVCIFMVDTRRTSSLRNITAVLAARFWTLAYGLNRLYAEEHGYEIEYVIPDNQSHFPERKVGWGKIKVVTEKLLEYGPERCAFGVSIDTDAYLRSSEPLAAAIHHYGLDRSKLILFSQEYHTELQPNTTFANGGFFIVRNSEGGIRLLQEWYDVPEDYDDMRHLKKENPQGLNLCWDRIMQPKYSDRVVLAPSHLFTAPRGWFVAHNWFKDLQFEQSMIEVMLQRLNRKYGCIMCDNVYDWDDSVNHDLGPQR